MPTSPGIPRAWLAVALTVLAIGALQVVKALLPGTEPFAARAGLPVVSSVFYHPELFGWLCSVAALFLIAHHVVYRRLWMLVLAILFSVGTITSGRRKSILATVAGVAAGAATEFVRGQGRTSRLRVWIPSAVGIAVLTVAFLPVLSGLYALTIEGYVNPVTGSRGVDGPAGATAPPGEGQEAGRPDRVAGAATPARIALYLGAVAVAADEFPLGAGLGRYGSWISRTNYSDVYREYGLDQILRPEPGEPPVHHRHLLATDPRRDGRRRARRVCGVHRLDRGGASAPHPQGPRPCTAGGGARRGNALCRSHGGIARKPHPWLTVPGLPADACLRRYIQLGRGGPAERRPGHHGPDCGSGSKVMDGRIRPVRPLIIVPIDPLSQKIGGIRSFVNDFIRFAPPDFEPEIIGCTADPVARPVGRWTGLDIGGRRVPCLPVLATPDVNRRSRLPLSLAFTVAAMARPSAHRFRGRVLQFHHPVPPAGFLAVDAPKILTVHLNAADIDAGGGESRWSRLPGALHRLEDMTLPRMNRVFIVNRAGLDFDR